MSSDRPPPFFVGEHLAIDFLNTVATPRGALVEWLGNGNDLVSWLQQAGAIDAAAAARSKRFGRAALEEIARDARAFRQWLRAFVTANGETAPRDGRRGCPVERIAGQGPQLPTGSTERE